MILIPDLHFHCPNSKFRFTLPECAVSSGVKITMIGPCGSGKTALLNLSAGIMAPGRRKVWVVEIQSSTLLAAGVS